MSIKTPEQRREEGIPHHPRSLEIEALIKEHDDFGLYEFGGDGDNGEELLYYLDMYFEKEDAA